MKRYFLERGTLLILLIGSIMWVSCSKEDNSFDSSDVLDPSIPEVLAEDVSVIKIGDWKYYYYNPEVSDGSFESPYGPKQIEEKRFQLLNKTVCVCGFAQFIGFGYYHKFDSIYYNYDSTYLRYVFDNCCYYDTTLILSISLSSILTIPNNGYNPYPTKYYVDAEYVQGISSYLYTDTLYSQRHQYDDTTGNAKTQQEFMKYPSCMGVCGSQQDHFYDTIYSPYDTLLVYGRRLPHSTPIAPHIGKLLRMKVKIDTMHYIDYQTQERKWMACDTLVDVFF